jgi:thiamine-phosphate pyrophosphorylase
MSVEGRPDAGRVDREGTGAVQAGAERTDAERVGPTPVRAAVRGLYAITPDEPDTDRLLWLVGEALAGGIDVLQYRSKLPEPALRRAQAAALKALLAPTRVPLIINDDVDLALEVDAAGVHLGRDDGDAGRARERLGPSRLIGVSCYDSLGRAMAVRGIADHVAFGSVFASSTKPHAVRAPLSLFAQARDAGLSTVGIGGIDSSNARSVIEAGADAVALIGDIFGQPDPRGAAMRLARAIRGYD